MPPTDVNQQILRHLMTIPLFDKLSEEEVGRIYAICRLRKFAADEAIYQFGQPSADMLILLDGQIVARTRAGVDIAIISPVGLVGEMGVITDEPRSADVVAVSEGMAFQITKNDLVALFLSDPGICRKMLLNLVRTLSRKLYDTNAEVEKLHETRKRQQDGAPVPDNIFLY
jgi:CRP-like cAMP-binding protein